MEWMLMPYRRYADFKGRSRRKEYWMFALLYLIVMVVCSAIMFAGGGGEPGIAFTIGTVLLGLFVLGSFIPALAVQVRRFHDQDKSGWFVLLNFIPYLGGLIVLVFMLLKGTDGPNRFGPDPLDPSQAETFA